MEYRKLFDRLFLMFEAGMHVYLSIYLIIISANIPVILFTVFEMIMFFKLLLNGSKKRKSDELLSSS